MGDALLRYTRMRSLVLREGKLAQLPTMISVGRPRSRFLNGGQVTASGERLPTRMIRILRADQLRTEILSRPQIILGTSFASLMTNSTEYSVLPCSQEAPTPR